MFTTASFRFSRSTAVLRFFLGVLVTSGASAQFGAEQVVHTSVSNTLAVRSADLDQDGDLDVIVGHSTRVDWIENRGPRTFGPPQVLYSIPFINSPRAIEVGDVDADGKQDIVVLRSGSGDLRWYRNRGSGLFQAVVIDPVGDRGTGVSIADVDGDGDLDVLSEASSLSQIRLYENLGGGGFGPRVVVTSQADRVFDHAAADYDGDGDVDLMAVCDGDDALSFFENDGTGSFGAEVVITTIPDPTGIEAADVDGDGDLDVVVSRWFDNSGQGDLRWYENLGNGAFGPARVVGTLGYVDRETFRVADFNGDGAVDLLVGLRGSFGPGGIRLFTNQGSGVFSAPVTVWIDERVEGIDVGDLDGDADLDVVTGHDTTIRWRESLALPNVRYCGPGAMNSTGSRATLAVMGSTRIADNALALRADGLPPLAAVAFLTSRTQGFVLAPGQSQGNLCLGGAIGRFTGPGQIRTSNGAGVVRLALDLTRMPAPSGLVAAQVGETWNFQAWHRDPNPGWTSNFSDGLSVTFL